MADDLKSGFDPSLPIYMQMGPPRYGRRRRVFFVPVAGSCGYAKVDARDYYRAMKLSWHTGKHGYPRATLPAQERGEHRAIDLHAFILGRREDYIIDHVDGDKRNCLRANLRHVTYSANAANRGPSESRSGLRGVVPSDSGRLKYWAVTFTVRRRRYSLAHCRTLEEAAPIANLGIALFYGQGTRLHNGEPFQASHVAGLVAGAAGISTKNLYRLLERTLGHGDELSAELRHQLITRYILA